MDVLVRIFVTMVNSREKHIRREDLFCSWFERFQSKVSWTEIKMRKHVSVGA